MSEFNVNPAAAADFREAINQTVAQSQSASDAANDSYNFITDSNSGDATASAIDFNHQTQELGTSLRDGQNIANSAGGDHVDGVVSFDHGVLTGTMGMG